MAHGASVREQSLSSPEDQHWPRGWPSPAASSWYDVFVPRADDLYDEHLEILEKEGLI